MSWLSRSPIDPFLLAIITAAVAGTFLPVTGAGVEVLDWLTTFAIALLFFLYGARMARGCTSGQALSGGATLSAGSWAIMFAIFGGAYGLAYFVRKLWN